MPSGPRPGSRPPGPDPPEPLSSPNRNQEPTPIALSWSGGKDSALALERLRSDPRWKPVGLLTSITRDYDRISIHGVRRSLLLRQVRSLGLPLTEVSLEPASSNPRYEAAFAAGLERLRSEHPGLQDIGFGDLFLRDVREYREELLARLGWRGVFPLWLEDTTRLAKYFIGRGFRAVLTCVDTTQLDGSFAGREFDAGLLAELPAAVDPCGERGEFHTFVYDGPIFREPIPVVIGERVLRDERFAYCDLGDPAG